MKPVWEPFPKQAALLSASDKEVLYGGAAGGGKSDCLLVDACGLSYGALEYPRYRAIIFRKTYPQLEELVDRSRDLYNVISPGAVYNEAKTQWVFPSGAKIKLRAMDRDSDRFKYQGHQYQYIGWDELTHWLSDVCYTYMFSRLRCSWSETLPLYCRAGTNPGGEGHAWVKKRWNISNDGAATRFKVQNTHQDVVYEHTRRFIPSLLEDNPFLMNDGNYVASLLQLPERERKMLLEGRWDVIEGQFFTEWNPDIHVIEPIQRDPEWRHWRALDWGYARPYSIGWYCQDFDGNIYRYRELYGCTGEPNEGVREVASDVAAKLREMESQDRKIGIEFTNNPADSAISSASGIGKDAGERSILDAFRSGKVSWNLTKKGRGSRVNGWMECRARLRNSNKDRSSGDGFYVFSTCTDFIRTIPGMLHDEKNPEDLNTDLEDHIADEWRYSLMSRRIKSERRAVDKQTNPYTMDGIAPVNRDARTIDFEDDDYAAA